MKKTSVGIIAVIGMVLASQASTIVKWGQAGGDTTIVTANASGVNQFGTTYDSAMIGSPADGTSGYDVNAAGQTRVFYGAMSVANNVPIIGNTGGTDQIQIVNNFAGAAGSLSSMIVWQAGDFLTADRELESIALEFKSRDGVFDNTSSILLETSAGWYMSDLSDTATSTYETWTIADVSALTWSGFSQFGVAAGAVAADITDVKSIGIYSTTTSTGGRNNIGVQIRNFEVTAIPEPASLGMIASVGVGVLFIRRRIMM